MKGGLCSGSIGFCESSRRIVPVNLARPASRALCSSRVQGLSAFGKSLGLGLSGVSEGSLQTNARNVARLRMSAKARSHAAITLGIAPARRLDRVVVRTLPLSGGRRRRRFSGLLASSLGFDPVGVQGGRPITYAIHSHLRCRLL